MRNTLLSTLRAIPVCRAAAHILAARMQKAVILGPFVYLERTIRGPSDCSSHGVRLYKAQIRSGLEHCLHIWGAAAPTILTIQRRAVRRIGDPS
nr:unnamed protein product [Callosobruchus chinensis]